MQQMQAYPSRHPGMEQQYTRSAGSQQTQETMHPAKLGGGANKASTDSEMPFFGPFPPNPSGFVQDCQLGWAEYDDKKAVPLSNHPVRWRSASQRSREQACLLFYELADVLHD